MTGNLEQMIVGADGITHLTISTRADFREQYDKLKDKECDITIKQHKEKRSLDANAYMWVLCEKIAEVLCMDGTKTTKEDVYRETVRQLGVFRDIPMKRGYEQTLRTAWEMNGIAWITEIIDNQWSNSDFTMVRCYYGSSVYNTAQLSRLIDALVQDCDALGIDHRTPAEINNLLSLWDSEPKEGKNG